MSVGNHIPARWADDDLHRLLLLHGALHDQLRLDCLQVEFVHKEELAVVASLLGDRKPSGGLFLIKPDEEIPAILAKTAVALRHFLNRAKIPTTTLHPMPTGYADPISRFKFRHYSVPHSSLEFPKARQAAFNSRRSANAHFASSVRSISLSAR